MCSTSVWTYLSKRYLLKCGLLCRTHKRRYTFYTKSTLHKLPWKVWVSAEDKSFMKLTVVTVSSLFQWIETILKIAIIWTQKICQKLRMWKEWHWKTLLGRS